MSVHNFFSKEYRESALLKKAKTDKRAFSKLYSKYVNPVFAFTRGKVSNLQDAEDLTSQVWMTVLEKLDTLKSDEIGAFRYWLFKIARNFIIDYYRSKKITINIDDYSDALADKSLHVIKNFDSAIKLQELLRLLPYKQSETISMSFFSELSNKEIASILDISEKTVASNLSRGLFKLRHLYQKLEQ